MSLLLSDYKSEVRHLRAPLICRIKLRFHTNKSLSFLEDELLAFTCHVASLKHKGAFFVIELYTIKQTIFVAPQHNSLYDSTNWVNIDFLPVISFTV